MEVSPPSPVPEVATPPITTNTTNPTSTKIGQTGEYQGEEKSKTIIFWLPKGEVLSKIFMGKLAQGEVL